MLLLNRALHIVLLIIFLCTTRISQATIVKGRILSQQTDEEIIGATIIVKEKPMLGTVTGLDGSFSLDTETDTCTLQCSYMGYERKEIRIVPKTSEVVVKLREEDIILTGVTVIAHNPGRSEAGARALEKQSMNVVNIMSAKSIELSPDITVANVIQRMSGVTIERNSSGEGQYAILRGMDKRYNYTLINGVKIASPDNKNRFVPLDMFPSEMLDRLEVSKSLTADMEGDGIGGAINLVMKDAPSEKQFTANIATGYNAMYFGRDFQSFRHQDIVRQSPYEAAGYPSDYAVSATDFKSSNMHMKWAKPLPDLNAGLSYGDRFFNDRLGIMLAGSYLNTARGKESQIYYQPGTTRNGIESRNYSIRQARAGIHAKIDLHLDKQNKLTWYNAYLDMSEAEVRDGQDNAERQIRMKWNHQYILNTTLKGEHHFLSDGGLRFDWSAVASKAFSETPDNVKLVVNGNHIPQSDAATRRWEHNSDADQAIYANLTYRLNPNGRSFLDFSAGGMFRNKQRTSFYNEYSFNSGTDPHHLQIFNKNWNNFDEVLLTPKPHPNIGDPLNYDATELISAGYAMIKYTQGKWEFITGLRIEHTQQGYNLKFPRSVDANGWQRYTDLLPSLHAKWNVHDKANLRLSYARSINRPSFFEIVPYCKLDEDYWEQGNPELKHTIADNIDLRYEFFPQPSEQFMLGLFYKHLKDPIEYGLIPAGQQVYYMPMNFGNATNVGLETDIIKYFNWIGVKANYTYTHSSITTQKRTMNEDAEVVRTEQTRPLFGQAAHVANLSLLFKSARHGLEGQIAFSYTSKRLSDISNWLDDDIWEAGYAQLDLSAEKTFKHGLTVYLKASNLFDTPLLRYIHSSPTTATVDSDRYKGNVIEREEWHGQALMIGIRYKL